MPVLLTPGQIKKFQDVCISNRDISDIRQTAKSADVIEAVLNNIELFFPTHVLDYFPGEALGSDIASLVRHGKSDIINAVVNNSEALKEKWSPWVRGKGSFGRGSWALTYIANYASSIEAVKALADNAEVFLKAGLDKMEVIEIIWAKSSVVVKAVAENVKKFKAAGFTGKQIMAGIAGNAESVELVNTVADCAAEFRTAGLDAEQIVNIAVNAVSAEVISAVANNATKFRDAGLDAPKIVSMAINVKSADDVIAAGDVTNEIIVKYQALNAILGNLFIQTTEPKMAGNVRDPSNLSKVKS